MIGIRMNQSKDDLHNGLSVFNLVELSLSTSATVLPLSICTKVIFITYNHDRNNIHCPAFICSSSFL